ncbi:hypothetical protein [Undibacterium sp.]|uniref:hypothetical protein n=1 Tax=Undibacterium sp. TaxID=1914977 RepID=UPI003753DA62
MLKDTKDKKINDAFSEAGSKHARGRTADVIQRTREALAKMEAEIIENFGVYPENSGRLTQTEVCRRAGIAKITLHSPAHRQTTRLEVESWIAKQQIKRKSEVQKFVSERADFWKNEHGKVASQICLYELQLIEKDVEIRLLRAENEVLREQLTMSGRRKIAALPKRGK